LKKKKAYINIIILNKLLKRKFRVNKLVKYPSVRYNRQRLAFTT